MNKIIVVGHPQSGYEQVLHLLVQCGMAPALPLRRENLPPEQISAVLIKAHGAVPVEQVQSAEQLQQIQVAPVWQGMVLDLMLGNLEQTLWGWSDSQAIYLLDYWKEQDPKVVFVLVYDEPQTAYTRFTLELATAQPEELQRRMDAWVAYNAALLHFHLRNPQRSVLVHAQQVQPSASSYLQQLSERIAAPLQLPSNQLLQAAQEVPAQIAVPPVSATDLPHNAQVALLASLLVDAHPQAQALYEELQAAASLPLNTGSPGALALHGTGTQACYQAWQACIAQYQMLASGAKAQQELQTKIDQHIEAEARIKSEWQVAQAYAEQLASEQQEENDLLQTQLHKVQQELEHLDQQGKQQKQDLQAQITQHLEAEAKLKAEWQAAQAQATQSASAQQAENDLLLIQLQKVQEALERLHQQDQQQTQELQAQIKQRTEIQAKLKAQELAAQAQAKQLATAQEALQKAQTELNAAQAQTKLHNEVQAKLKAQEQATQTQAKQLATVQATLQKTQTELNAAQKKTASAELQQENSILLEQLHTAQEELERYYLENLKLKAEQKPQPKEYYGAASRIKQQLSYRLGATMIAKSRSLGGWLSMPFALRAQVKRFRQEGAIDQEENLPPISKYRDAQKAEQVKRHLSYRLGTRMLANAKSLSGCLAMPWALYAEVRNFRKNRA